MLVVGQGRERFVAVRVPLDPVGRDRIVRGRTGWVVGVMFGFAVPGNVAFGQGVRLALTRSTLGVEQLQVDKRVCHGGNGFESVDWGEDVRETISPLKTLLAIRPQG